MDAAGLDTVRGWVDNGEVTPAALALLESVLLPLIDTQADDSGRGPTGDGNGNGSGRGSGNVHGNDGRAPTAH